MPKNVHIPVDGKRVELDQIKQRQRARKADGMTQKVTNEALYQMGLDILENQARQENTLRELRELLNKIHSR